MMTVISDGNNIQIKMDQKPNKVRILIDALQISRAMLGMIRDMLGRENYRIFTNHLHKLIEEEDREPAKPNVYHVAVNKTALEQQLKELLERKNGPEEDSNEG